jgi:hypothetical protein
MKIAPAHTHEFQAFGIDEAEHALDRGLTSGIV